MGRDKLAYQNVPDLHAPFLWRAYLSHFSGFKGGSLKEVTH